MGQSIMLDCSATPKTHVANSSGFIIPALGDNREFCSLVAARTQCIVFDADYRKSPEHPFPAAIQDAEDITCYLTANSDKYDSSNIFLCGFSAGGNIALVTASALGPERVKGVLAFYPVVDLTERHPAPEKRFLAGAVIPAWCIRVFDEAYTLPDQRWNDPRISVTLAPAESFPNYVYVVCGNADTLYDPARKFVEKLKEAGHKDAKFVGLEYMAHAFDANPKKGTEAEDTKVKVYAEAVDVINSAIGATI
jgi:acetyl esterase/lipase